MNAGMSTVQSLYNTRYYNSDLDIIWSCGTQFFLPWNFTKEFSISPTFFTLHGKERSGRVVDSRPRGCRLGASPASLRCVLEQDTSILAKYWFNPGGPVPL